MQKTLLICSILLLPLFFSCKVESSNPTYVATSQPLSFILSEIVGTVGQVHTIVPSGASPHTYAPKPTDMYKINAARALFFASHNLDGWAATLADEKSVEMIAFLPHEYLLEFPEPHSHDHGHEGHGHEGEHEHEGHEHESMVKHEGITVTEADEHSGDNIDPHFWMDPLTVKAMLPNLVAKLSELDPDNAKTYANNADLFSKRLDLLHKQADKIVNPVKGRPVFLFHPSMLYFMNRYKLIYAGAIELSPGQEATADHLKELIEEIKASGAKAIFSEPQLPDKPAKVISEAANVSVYILDPIGVDTTIINYSKLILYNARKFSSALR